MDAIKFCLKLSGVVANIALGKTIKTRQMSITRKGDVYRLDGRNKKVCKLVNQTVSMIKFYSGGGTKHPLLQASEPGIVVHSPITYSVGTAI